MSGMMLCSTCLQISETYKRDSLYPEAPPFALGPGKILPWHTDLASFENGLQMRCLVCLEVWGVLNTTKEYHSGPDVKSIDDLRGCTGSQSGIRSIADLRVRRSRPPDDTEYEMLLTLEFCFWENGTMEKHAMVRIVGFDTATMAGTDTVPQLISTTWNESSRAQATQWYEKCRNNHTTCNLEVGGGNCSPTRLLDLSDSINIKLVETSVMAFKDQYVTLSHCWGGEVPLKLLENNINDFKKQIHIDRLPKTFVHAIEVARRLQFRYLWIDSLCIIQDSETDWRQESMSMAEVYSNASLNIAATASRDGHGGLYHSNPIQCVADAWWTEDRYVSTHFITLATHQNSFDQINSAPLNRRGWVLQERLLSPRVLHFAHSQMFWECEEAISSQIYPAEVCSPGGHPAQLTQLTKMSNRTRILKSPNDVRTNNSVELNTIYKSWRAWIEQYSAAAITMPSDKFIAISALAKIVEHATKDIYVSGLWRNDMPMSLMWCSSLVEQPGKPLPKRLKKKQAPTWSWAALDCSIEFSRCPEPDSVSASSSEFTQLIDVKGDSSKLQQNYDETGQLVGGELHLRGDLFEVRITVGDLGDWWFDYSDPFLEQFGWGGMRCDISLEERSTTAIFLPLYWRIGGNLSGLVLQPVPAQSFGWYQRIGVFSFQFHGSWPEHAGRSLRIAYKNASLFLPGTENELIII